MAVSPHADRESPNISGIVPSGSLQDFEFVGFDQLQQLNMRLRAQSTPKYMAPNSPSESPPPPADRPKAVSPARISASQSSILFSSGSSGSIPRSNSNLGGVSPQSSVSVESQFICLTVRDWDLLSTGSSTVNINEGQILFSESMNIRSIMTLISGQVGVVPSVFLSTRFSTYSPPLLSPTSCPSLWGIDSVLLNQPVFTLFARQWCAFNQLDLYFVFKMLRLSPNLAMRFFNTYARRYALAIWGQAPAPDPSRPTSPKMRRQSLATSEIVSPRVFVHKTSLFPASHSGNLPRSSSTSFTSTKDMTMGSSDFDTFLNSKDERFRSTFDLTPNEMIIYSLTAIAVSPDAQDNPGTLYLGRRCLSFWSTSTKRVFYFKRLKAISFQSPKLTLIFRTKKQRSFQLTEQDGGNFASVAVHLFKRFKRQQKNDGTFVPLPARKAQQLSQDLDHYLKAYQISEFDWELLTRDSPRLHFSAGTLLFSSFEPRIYMIISGTCSVSIHPSAPIEDDCFYSFGPGDCVGLNSLLQFNLLTRAQTDIVVTPIDIQTLLVRFSISPALGARFFYYYFKWIHRIVFNL